jgi:hypothetical protein
LYPETAQYGIYVDSFVDTGLNRINNFSHDGTHGQGSCYIVAGARPYVFIGQKPYQTISYAATITPDPLEGETVFVPSITGSLEIATPSEYHAFEGAKLTFILKQDSTGGRAVTWDTANSRISLPDTMLDKTPNGVSSFSFVYETTSGGDGKWRCVSEVWHPEALRDTRVFQLTTTDATKTTLASFTIPENTAYLLEASVLGMQIDGADQAGFGRVCVAYRDGAAVAALRGTEGAIFTTIPDGAAAWACAWELLGGGGDNNIYLKVTGDVANSVYWRAVVRYLKAAATA